MTAFLISQSRTLYAASHSFSNQKDAFYGRLEQIAATGDENLHIK